MNEQVQVYTNLFYKYQESELILDNYILTLESIQHHINQIEIIGDQDTTNTTTTSNTNTTTTKDTPNTNTNTPKDSKDNTLTLVFYDSLHNPNLTSTNLSSILPISTYSSTNTTYTKYIKFKTQDSLSLFKSLLTKEKINYKIFKETTYDYISLDSLKLENKSYEEIYSSIKHIKELICNITLNQNFEKILYFQNNLIRNFTIFSEELNELSYKLNKNDPEEYSIRNRLLEIKEFFIEIKDIIEKSTMGLNIVDMKNYMDSFNDKIYNKIKEIESMIISVKYLYKNYSVLTEAYKEIKNITKNNEGNINIGNTDNLNDKKIENENTTKTKEVIKALKKSSVDETSILKDDLESYTSKILYNKRLEFEIEHMQKQSECIDLFLNECEY